MWDSYTTETQHQHGFADDSPFSKDTKSLSIPQPQLHGFPLYRSWSRARISRLPQDLLTEIPEASKGRTFMDRLCLYLFSCLKNNQAVHQEM